MRDKFAAAVFANVGVLKNQFFAVRTFDVGLWGWFVFIARDGRQANNCQKR
jgi:hypothetical protein